MNPHCVQTHLENNDLINDIMISELIEYISLFPNRKIKEILWSRE